MKSVQRSLQQMKRAHILITRWVNKTHPARLVAHFCKTCGPRKHGTNPVPAVSSHHRSSARAPVPCGRSPTEFRSVPATGVSRWVPHRIVYTLTRAHRPPPPASRIPYGIPLAASLPPPSPSAAYLGFPPPSPSDQLAGASARVPRRRMCVRPLANLDRRHRTRLRPDVVEDAPGGVPPRRWRRRRPEEAGGG
jgi:hypothetical protein